ncbi:MAG TPA: hypothetical protein ENK80_04380, partial [Rhodobacterales bacterium]|nr:hypothetical protein [Rhodobacterales bacterium]
AWSDVQPDLGQAVLILAAHLYETRGSGSGTDVDLPPAVQMLLGRWRNVRLLGGGAL